MAVSARVILKDKEGREIMYQTIFHKNEEQLIPYMQAIIARKYIPQLKPEYKIEIDKIKAG